MSTIANNTYVQQIRETACSSDFTGQVTNSLQNLKSHGHTVETKPDEGRGIVVHNKTDYIDKLFSVLSDSSKFQQLKC